MLSTTKTARYRVRGLIGQSDSRHLRRTHNSTFLAPCFRSCGFPSKRFKIISFHREKDDAKLLSPLSSAGRLCPCACAGRGCEQRSEKSSWLSEVEVLISPSCSRLGETVTADVQGWGQVQGHRRCKQKAPYLDDARPRYSAVHHRQRRGADVLRRPRSMRDAEAWHRTLWTGPRVRLYACDGGGAAGGE